MTRRRNKDRVTSTYSYYGAVDYHTYHHLFEDLLFEKSRIESDQWTA